MHEGRAQRVGEQVRKEIADLLVDGVKDPRIGFVSVMEVKMSPDLGYADVYVSLYGSERERASSLIGLQRSAGWMRRALGKRVRLRVTPELRFKEDNTLDTVYRIEERLREIHAEQEHDRTEPERP
jgi:ribosome-binding factor A